MRNDHQEESLILIYQPDLFFINELFSPGKSWDCECTILTPKFHCILNLDKALLNSKQVGSIVDNSHVELLATPKYLLDLEGASGIERIVLLHLIGLVEQNNPVFRQNDHDEMILNDHNLGIPRHLSVNSWAYHDEILIFFFKKAEFIGKLVNYDGIFFVKQLMIVLGERLADIGKHTCKDPLEYILLELVDQFKTVLDYLQVLWLRAVFYFDLQDIVPWKLHHYQLVYIAF